MSSLDATYNYKHMRTEKAPKMTVLDRNHSPVLQVQVNTSAFFPSSKIHKVVILWAKGVFHLFTSCGPAESTF